MGPHLEVRRLRRGMVRQQPVHHVEELLDALVAAQVLAALPSEAHRWACVEAPSSLAYSLFKSKGTASTSPCAPAEHAVLVAAGN